MSTGRNFEPPQDFVDPRQQPDFEPQHWPLCNGEPAPQNPADAHERRCVEFLAHFYELNRLHSRLLDARASTAADDVISGIMEQISAATEAVERAEDRYAPIGFFPEPVMEGIRYQDIKFVRPELPRVFSAPAPQCVQIAIPMDGIPAEELSGPRRILRFRNGKMDL